MAEAEKRRRSPERFVYFVLAERLNMVKIGVANDPLARLAAIRPNCPDTLALLGVIFGAEADDVEREAHRKFAHLRETGEWFNRAVELDAFIASETVSLATCRQQLVDRTRAKRFDIQADDDPWRLGSADARPLPTLAAYKAARGLG